MQAVKYFVRLLLLSVAVAGCVTVPSKTYFERKPRDTSDLGMVERHCYLNDFVPKFNRISRLMPNCDDEQLSQAFNLFGTEYIKALYIEKKYTVGEAWLAGYSDACLRIKSSEDCKRRTNVFKEKLEIEFRENRKYFQREVANALDGRCVYRELFSLVYNQASYCAQTSNYLEKKDYEEGYISAVKTFGRITKEAREEDFMRFSRKKEFEREEFESKHGL